MSKDYRIEHDTMGQVQVPAERYWGAQTQRSLENFRIGNERMPNEIIRQFAVLKKAAAIVNEELGLLDNRRANAIAATCDEILDGIHEDEFPLVIWQTGSGTQTNMNVNEVIANRANEILSEKIVHPNDHVNCSQSSNDTFPAAMHMAALCALTDNLLPAIRRLEETFWTLSNRYAHIIKTGRTHLQDATPITLGQEISAWAKMLQKCGVMIENTQEGLRELALGGTAVGTGLNAHKDFAVSVAGKIAELTGKPFQTADNKFHALTSRDALAYSHGALKALACDLMKIANDVRWLASGPRCGIGEICIPENEPGSSIMPGKVNPTQCEALTMVCAQVMGNDTVMSIGASQGNFQLNVYMPVMIYNYLQSATLLADGMESFRKNCAVGIVPNEARIGDNLEKSLMLVTALNPHLGYEKAAKIAKKAHEEGITLKEAAVALGLLSPEAFDRMVVPAEMV